MERGGGGLKVIGDAVGLVSSNRFIEDRFKNRSLSSLNHFRSVDGTFTSFFSMAAESKKSTAQLWSQQLVGA